MKFKQNKKIVLASQSPRRKEYLNRYSLEFRIVTGDIDETAHPQEAPLDFVKRMAREKAEAVIQQCESDEIVIAADTIVVHDGAILGKPTSHADAFQMLKKLNGEIHQVITAYVIHDCSLQTSIQKNATSRVKFKPVGEPLLQTYANTQDPLDKAGSYSVQEFGTFLVEKIDGSINNVIGLPIEMVIEDMLEKNYLTI